MAQHTDENKDNNAVQTPDVSQSDKQDKAAQALAKLEADLKAEKGDREGAEAEQQENNVLKTTSSKASKRKEQDTEKRTSSSHAQVAQTRSKSFSWTAMFALLLSLLAVAAVGVLYWQSQLWLNNQAQLEQMKQQSLLTTQQTLNQQQAQITDLLTKLSQQENRQQLEADALKAMQNRLAELGESQPNHWLAAEANYLVNLAERRLLVEADVATSIQLLVDAEQRLAAMQDPSVFHIRTAISQDIAALNGLVQSNTDDIYLTLSGLITESAQLPFAQVHIPQQGESEQDTQRVTGEISDWQQNLQVSLQRFFAHFVTIRKQERQVQPQLPADQQWFVRANLTTQVLMAQHAVLAHDQSKYADALQHIATWASAYFDLADPQVVAFVNQLDHLRQQNVALNLPKGLSAQPLVANYVIDSLQLKQSNVLKEQSKVLKEQSND